MNIQKANLALADIQSLLAEHLDSASKQDASHAYSLEQLRANNFYFFSARNHKNELMGFAGLLLLNAKHGEIKSVRTHPEHLRKGVSKALMLHLTTFAKQRNLTRLSLETHPTPAYTAARAMYERLGYKYCDAFADYRNCLLYTSPSPRDS